MLFGIFVAFTLCRFVLSHTERSPLADIFERGRGNELSDLGARWGDLHSIFSLVSLFAFVALLVCLRWEGMG